jgi:glycosyltransferase involved in cell wall biosynthesis
LRILALLPDAFGGHGGIALYNRDLLTALCDNPRVEEVVAIVRWMPNPPEGPLPAKLTYETAGVRGWTSYVSRTLIHCLRRRRFDLVVCGHIHIMPLASAAAWITGAALFLEIYGIEAWVPGARKVANRMLRGTHGVIAISDYTRRRFLAWSRVPEEKTGLLPNAIHAERYGVGYKSSELAQRYGLAGRRVLLTLGRLVSKERAKGFDEVLELLPRLARRIPDISYVIAGEGEDKPRLQRKARRLGIAERVVFTGMVREEEKPDLYRLADVYVMPSRGEGFGFVFLEAMACGVPVVASKADGSRDAVRGGELGLLVDPDDPAEIEAAILESLSRPREVPAGLEYFSFERFRQRLGRVLDRLPEPQSQSPQSRC